MLIPQTIFFSSSLVLNVVSCPLWHDTVVIEACQLLKETASGNKSLRLSNKMKIVNYPI